MQVVTREAMFNGLTDCSIKAALLDWALPYAQRYLHSTHPDKYSQLKQSGFDILNHLRVVEVQQLSYHNVIKIAGSESKKRIECSCLLQVIYSIFHPMLLPLFLPTSLHSVPLLCKMKLM